MLYTAFSTPVPRSSADDQTRATVREGTQEVSGFITVSSFTNLSAMTGAIAAAWGALENLSEDAFGGRTFPLVACLIFGLVSVVASDLEKKVSVQAPAYFIALINSLTLFGAVIGARGLIT